jgi:uncharacterized protein YggE
MKTLYGSPLLPVVALLAAIGFIACGGGSDEPPQIVRAAVAGAAERLGDAAAGDQAPGDATVPGFGQAPNISEASATALQQSANGITVTGYGVASVEADSAFLELYFGGYYVPVPATDDEAVPGGGVSYRSAIAISESDLQPVIDALVDAGAEREDIELLGGTYYDPYSNSGTLRVTMRNLDDIDSLVEAAAEGAGEVQDIYLQGTYVSYTVEDCAALAQTALNEAVTDARERGAALAQALDVNLGEVVAAGDYGWSPFGGTPCGTSYAGPVPIGGVAYAESQARQVQFYATISVTFALG